MRMNEKKPISLAFREKQNQEREREKRLIDRGKDFIDVQKDRKNVRQTNFYSFIIKMKHL